MARHGKVGASGVRGGADGARAAYEGQEATPLTPGDPAAYPFASCELRTGLVSAKGTYSVATGDGQPYVPLYAITRVKQVPLLMSIKDGKGTVVAKVSQSGLTTLKMEVAYGVDIVAITLLCSFISAGGR